MNDNWAIYDNDDGQSVEGIILLRDYAKALLNESNALIQNHINDESNNTNDFWELMGYAKACEHIYQKAYNLSEGICDR